MKLRNILVESTTAPLEQIADNLGISYVAIRNWFSKNYSAEFRKQRKIANYRASKLGENNPMKGKFGSLHHNFIGRVSDNKGYYTVLKPLWWTGLNKSKRVFEHHVVYCAANGLTCLPEGYEIHHIDHDPGNNDISNLMLVTPEEHKQIHYRT